jgi:hypothetical protein
MKIQQTSLVLSLIACAGLAATAHAQCNGFSTSVTPGGTIVPGTVDIGNHGDDTVTALPLPFNVLLYGVAYNTANVSSNGNIQFTTSSNAYGNQCLPATAMGVALFPHWDDLRTNLATGGNGTLGIFTSISGVAPNRIFNIEWRAVYFTGGSPLNFQVRLYEDASKVEFIYADNPGLNSSATVGAQHTTFPSTQYVCSSAGLAANTTITLTCSNGPLPPQGTGSASPSNMTTCGSGATTLLAVQATPGFNPASTGMTVVADLSSIGGSGTQSFYDDGTHGDATAGDNRFSYQATLPANSPTGSRTIPWTLSDVEGRSTAGVVGLNVAACPTAGPDVYIGDLSDMSAYGTVDVDPSPAVLNVSAYSVGTNACNLGDVPVLWIDHNSTPGHISNEHPVIAQNMYRIMNGRLEQIGQSWLKHGFVSTNSPFCSSSCVQPPMGGDQLGVNCSDLYGSGLNGSQGSLGPRSQVNATTGYYPHPFTAPAADATIGRRLQVYSDDITPSLNPGAIYLVDGQYVTADDARWSNGSVPAMNAMNNSSYRLITPGANPNSVPAWAGNTVRYKAAIHAWKDLDPTVILSDAEYIDTTLTPVGIVGRFIVGCKVTDNGNGTWHYEYAVYNKNADRSGGSFTVPVDPSATITNIGFHGVFAHSGEPYPNTALNPSNWTGSKVGGNVSWACAPYEAATNGNSSNALRWGTLYNFRFDADRPPQDAAVTLGLFKPATANNPATTAVAAGVKAPTLPPSVCGTSDFNGDGDFGTDQDIEAFFACLGGTCCQTCWQGGADFNGDGDFGTDQDIEAFFRVLGGGNC